MPDDLQRNMTEFRPPSREEYYKLSAIERLKLVGRGTAAGVSSIPRDIYSAAGRGFDKYYGHSKPITRDEVGIKRLNPEYTVSDIAAHKRRRDEEMNRERLKPRSYFNEPGRYAPSDEEFDALFEDNDLLRGYNPPELDPRDWQAEELREREAIERARMRVINAMHVKRLPRKGENAHRPR